MPKENASPAAILDALKKIDIVSELLEDKNKNNLKMIEGKVSGGKQIGPYARLLRPQEPERRACHFQDRRRSTARRGNDRRVAR